MKPFREISASQLSSLSLPDEMKAWGYLLIRNVLPVEDVTRMVEEITRIVSASGWLLPDRSPAERISDVRAACGDPDPAFKRVYEQIFNLQAFHAFAHHPALRQVMHLLVGRDLLVHPKPIGRLIFPNCDRLVIHAHQDHRSLDGDAESFTAWMPLHDCPVEVGPLGYGSLACLRSSRCRSDNRHHCEGDGAEASGRAARSMRGMYSSFIA